jgi:hypothetical protein
MSRTLTRSHKAFAIALVVVTVLAFTPAGWLGWTQDLHRIINFPLMPFRHMGTAVSGWLMPEHEIQLREFEGEQHLLQEYEELGRRYIAAQLRIEELEEQLSQIQQIPIADTDVPIRPISARITARDPRSRTANVQINRGSEHGVIEGTIAVFAGVHLIGKVSNADRMSSMLLPITNRDHGPLWTVVIPPDQLLAWTADAVQLEVHPQGDGTFHAEPHADVPISAGDIVRMAANPHWPRSSMGMVIGVVDSVSDEQSLRKRVVIRPRYEASHVSSVVLKIEDYDDEVRTR